MPQWVFVPTGNFLVDIMGDFTFEWLYTQFCWAYDDMVEVGIDWSYYFVGSGEGITDAETILEMVC